MPDVRTLLRESAAEPAQPLHVKELLERASRRAWWRRAGVVIPVLLAALGLGAPVRDVLVSANDDRVVASPQPTPTTTEARREDQHDRHDRRRDETDATGGQTATAPPARATSQGGAEPTPTTQPSSAPSSQEAGGSSLRYVETEPNEVEGCRADGHTNNVQLGNQGGGGVEQYPSCGYRATTEGGYVGNGKWEVRIERGPYTIVFNSADDADCGDVGLIQPGDYVTATALTGVNTPEDWFIEVGTGIRC